MTYLLLSILFNSLLFVFFKVFKKYEINVLHAIIVNYFTASFLGFTRMESPVSLVELPEKPWFWWSVILGLNFITVFNILALTTQKGGVSVASVVSKMSMVIPIVLAFAIYGDKLTVFKALGIALALAAVYLTAKKTGSKGIDWRFVYLPVFLFVGSGSIDALLKYISFNYVPEDEMDYFSSFTFFTAGSYGVVYLLYLLAQNKLVVKFKSLLAGICLGIPNYFSLYYLIMALNSNGLESSVVFPLNNVGIVLLSSLVGLAIFKENLTLRNWTGIAFAVISIVLVSIS